MALLYEIMRGVGAKVEAVTPAVLPAIAFEEAPYDAPLERQPLLGSQEANTRTFQVVSGAISQGPIVEWGSFSNGLLAYNFFDIFCLRIRYAFEGAESYRDLSEAIGTDVEQLSIAIAKSSQSDWPAGTLTLDVYSQSVDDYDDFYILNLCFRVNIATTSEGC